MSVLDTRLDRLAPALTAKERVLLVMRAWRAGNEPDREWLRLPDEQKREYDRYVGLIYTANIQLGAYAHVIALRAEHLVWDFGNLERLDRGATLMEEENPEEAAATRTRGWRNRPQTVPDFLRAMWLETREVLQRELDQLWREVRSVEMVWAEIDAEFDGEQVAETERRAQVEETKAKLKGLARSLTGARRPKKLPEPNEEMVSQVRGLVDEAFDALGLVKEI